MRKIDFLLTPLVIALAYIPPTAPAQAQASNTFVSAATGSDSNDCSTVATPCLHFQAAVNATAVGGVVAALDPGDYGPMTISHAITIEGQDWSYITPPLYGTAITINAAAGDTVKIRGISLDGAGVGIVGIIFNSGGRLEITDCVVSNFTNNGIIVYSATAMSLLISKTIVRDTSVSISLNANALAATITGVFDEVTASNSGGVFAGAFYAPLQLLIANSHIDDIASSSTAVDIFGSTANATSTVILKNLTLTRDFYAVVLGGNANVYLSHVTQTTPPGFTSSAGVLFLNSNNAAFSDGTNHFGGVISGGTLSSWPPQ
jgi:hypothetical protein